MRQYSAFASLLLSSLLIFPFVSYAQFLTSFGTSGSGNGQFQQPSHLTIASNGNLYVADQNNNRIQIFNGNGTFISSFGTLGSGMGSLNTPVAIDFSSASIIYVLEAGNYRVQAFDLSGAAQWIFGSQGAGQGQFSTPTGIAVDGNGDVYVAESNRIQKFDSFGNYISTLGNAGSGVNQYESIQFIETDASNNLYVADGGVDGEILKFNPSGSLIGSVAVGFPLRDVAITSTHIYAAGVNDVIYRYTTSLTFVDSFAGNGAGSGFFNDLSSIEVENNFNRIYATDIVRNSVEIFSIVPEPSTQATNLSFSNVTSSSVTLSWTSGDGSSRLVVGTVPGPVLEPTDGVFYSGSPVFGAGSEVSPGHYVVYVGSASTVNISGLSPSTNYVFKVFEFNGTTTTNYRLASAVGNPSSIMTSAPTCTADAGANNTVNWCNDSQLDLFFSLSGTPDAGGTWTQISGPGSPIITGDLVDLTGAAGGIYQFEYRVTEASCPDVTAVVTVNVTAQLFPGTSNSINVCNNNPSVILTSALLGGPDSGGTWTKTSGTSNIPIAGDAADFTGAVPGVYTFDYVIGGGTCAILTSTLTVTVDEEPDAGSSATVGACNTDASFDLLTGLGGTPDPSGTWLQTSGTSTISIIGSVADFLGVVPDSYTFDYTVMGAGACPSAVATLTVNVAGNADPGTNNFVDLCNPQGVVDLFLLLGGTPTPGGSWSQVSGPVITIAGNDANFTGAVADTYLFQYDVTGCSGSASAQVTVTLNEAPAINAGADASVCETDFSYQLNATASNQTGITWTHNGTGMLNSTSIANPIYSFGPGETGTITFTALATAAAGCSNVSDQVTLTISPAPFVNAGGAASICEGNNFNIVDATASNYSAILWTTSGVGSFSDATALTTTYTPGPGETGVITLTLNVTGLGTCSSIAGNKTLTIYGNASAANAGADQNQCNNGVFLMSANTPAVGTGSWFLVSGTATIADPASPTTLVTGIPQGASATLQWIISNFGCNDTFDEVVLTNEAPPSVADAGFDVTNCNDSNFLLNAAFPVVGTGSWSVVNGTATIVSPNSPTTSVSGVPAGTSATLRWTITNGTCAASFDDMLLTNLAPPSNALAGIDQNQCNNGVFTMSANAPVVGEGSWSLISGSASITDPTSATTTVTGVALGTSVVLRWTISNGICTPSADDVTLTNETPPSIAVAGPDQSLCNTASFLMAANTPVIGSGFWTIVNGSATITDPSSATTTVTGVASGTSVTLRWTISNGTCTASFDDVVLTNQALPSTAAAGPDQTQCNTATFPMAANTPAVGTGSWSIVSGSASITSPTSPTTTVTGVPVGTSVTLRWTISNGSCTSTFDDVVLNNQAPVSTAVAGADQTQCNNGSFTISANTPVVGTGTWSVANGSATITTPSSPTTTVTGVAAGASVTLRWTILNGTCPLSFDDVILTNQALPSTAVAGADQTQCNNGSFVMSANTPTVGTGSWSAISGTPTITNATSPTTSVTGIPAGTSVTLRWTISNGTCTSTFDDVVLTNQAAPSTAAAGADQTQCNNGSFAMTANAPVVGTGLWSIVNGAATITIANDATTTITNVPVGTSVTLRWTISNGICTASFDDVVLTNEAAPTTALAGGDQTQCNNGNFTMSANTPVVGTGLWSVVNGSASITTPTSATTTITGVPVGTSVTLRWTISNGTCTPSFDEVTLTNESGPSTALAGGDQTQCNNGNFTMAANTPAVGTGSWSVVNGSASITTPISATTTITGVPAGTSVTLRWTISNGGCTPNFDDVVLTNEAPPTTAVAGIDQTQCNNGTFAMAANSPAVGTGLWTIVSGSASITTPSSATTTITGVPAGTSVTLRWTISNGTCTASFDEVVLTNESAPTTALAGADQSQCNNSSFTMAANTPVVGTGLWSIVNGTASITDPTSATTTITGVTVGTSVTLRWTISNGICTPSFDDVVLTNGTGAVVNNPGNQTVCSGSLTAPVNFTGTASSFNWTNDNPSIGLAASGSGNIPAFTATNSGVANITVTPVLGACTGSSIVFTITVNSAGTVNNPGNQTLCSGNLTSAINFTGTASIYNWTNDNPAIGLGASGSGNISSFVATNAGTANITVTPVTGVCSGTPVIFTITVNATGTVNFPGNQTVCSGSLTAPVNFTGVATAYNWTNNNPSIGLAASGSGNIPAFTTTGSGVAVITVTPVNGACAGTPENFSIAVDQQPSIASAGSDLTNCNASSFVMNAAVPAVGTGAWSIVNGSATIANPSSANTTVSAVPVGTSVTLRWTVSNGSCTPSFDDVLITNDAEPTIANAGIDQTQCNNSNFTLSANTPVVGTGLWTVVSGAATITVNTSPSTTVTGVAAGSNVTLRWTITNGSCTPSFDEVTLINVNGPTTANAGADINQCSNSVFTLAGNTPVTGTGTWTVISGSATIVTPNAPGTQVTDVAAGSSVTLRWTISNGGCPPTFDDVTISNNISGAVGNPGNQAVCSGSNTSPISFTGTATTYTWTNNNPAIGLAASGSGNIGSFVAANAGSATITVTPDNAGCLGTPQIFVIEVSAVPTTANAGSDAAICGSSIALSGNGPVVGNGEWSVVNGPGGSFSSATNPSPGFSGAPGVYTLRWTISNGACPPSADDVQITLNEVPVLFVDNQKPEVPSGQATAINLSSNVPGTTFSFTVTASNVTGAQSGNGSSITQTIVNLVATDQTVVYNVLATSPAGCESAGQPVIVKILGSTTLPTVITSDSVSLVSLYQQLGGGSWTNRSNWLTGKVNTWFGVTVSNMRVVALLLPANNLRGVIPSQLGALSRITNLDLSNNNITGSVPSLPADLVTLKIDQNQVTALPPLPSGLNSINVSFNNISALPDVSGLPLLELDVRNNNLTFEDIQPILSVSGLAFNPQKDAETPLDILVDLGANRTFTSTLPEPGNQYQWFKNGVAIAEAIQNQLTLNNITLNDEAVYHYTAVNAAVPGLELKRSAIILKVSSLKRDSIALTALYQATEGSKWTNNTNWTTTSITSGWFGVTITNNRVTAVNLSNNNLVGNAPIDLKDIGSLQTLNLSNNKLTFIPDLTGLKDLTSVNVSSNNLQFNSLEQNAAIAGINYSNQGIIGTASETKIPVTSPYQLSVDVGGQSNVYQWRLNTTNLQDATTPLINIDAIGRTNMGVYECVITNPLVPNLTLQTAPQTVWATSSIQGQVFATADQQSQKSKLTLLKVNDSGKYDTTSVQNLEGTGAYNLNDVIVGDYILLAAIDTIQYERALPTYFGNTIFWEEASPIILDLPIADVNITAQYIPDETLAGSGVINGFLEDVAEDEGRSQAGKRVSGAGATVRRVSGQGRGKEDLVLVGYVFTNENGEFSFEKLDPGSYRLNIQYPGFPMDPNSFVTITVGEGFEAQKSVAAQVEGGKIVVREVIITGISDEDVNISVYPNPASEILTLDFGYEVPGRAVEIYNTMGSVKMRADVSSAKSELNVSELASGSYYLRILSAGKRPATVQLIIR